jgi:hypothetical protein
MRPHRGAGADAHVRADHGVRPDLDRRIELAPGVDDGRGMDRHPLSPPVAWCTSARPRRRPPRPRASSLELVDAGLGAQQLHVHHELVARLHRPLEAGAVDAGEVVDRLVVGRDALAANDSSAAACAIASSISTPGITGRCGKWPVKNGSLMVTFLSAGCSCPAPPAARGRPAGWDSGAAASSGSGGCPSSWNFLF